MSRKRKNNSKKPLSVGFVSLGCAKNLVDSQLMAGVLIKEGVALARSPEEADVVIINTCSFIEDAREEAVDAIEEVCELKRGGGCAAVLVAGCLPQRYKSDLRAQFPDVDAFIGVDEIERVGDIVRKIASGDRGVIEVSETAVRLFEPKVPGVVFTGGPYAYLKIAEGCDHQCSFCAIPAIRGSYRSRPVKSLLAEAERLLERGFREINLISQDVTSYGRDAGNGANLPLLLRELDKLGGQFWIRLLYGYPTGLTDELIRVMADLPRVCRYFDIPIQHSHPDILRAMKRGATIESALGMARRIRETMPDATLRTTCIVGFPGETEEQFAHLLDFVAAAEFDHLGAFCYSPEAGTPAADLPDRLDPAACEERRNRLLLAQSEVVAKKAASLIGSHAKVLLERLATDLDNVWTARSKRLAPEVDGVVLVSDLPDGAKAGDFVSVRYTAQNEYDMEAVVAD